jgi:hypothetical protein
MPSNNWKDYIDAAYRKIAIAKFHCEQLNITLQQEGKTRNKLPSIPIQAFFEGVVVATIAAIDQVAQAANSVFQLHLTAKNLFDGASSEIEKYVPEFKDWRENPIGRDLRRLRTRIVHYSYVKASNRELFWHVEAADNNYIGTRDLSGYAKAVVAYADELGSLAEKLEDLLSKNDADLANTEVE